MSFDQAAVLSLVDSVVSHAMALGVFESVNFNEPKSPPGSGIRCAAWVQSIEPIGLASGLASTSGKVVLNVRVYGHMLSEPADETDPAVLTAVTTLIGAYSGDFNFGATVRNVDLLGSYGTPLSGQAGYVTIGKALSGGFYPVSAFLASDEVMDVFTPGIHGSTYGGNPLACAVASAALDVLVEERLVEQAAVLGGHLRHRLETMKTDKLAEVRVIGLWAGVQLKPEAGGARKYCHQLKDRGMLCKDTHVDTIRLAPPLVITKAQIDWAVDQLEAVLA